MSRVLTLFDPAAGALGGGTPLSFQEQILALPGLIAYWPLSETSGTTADNAEGTAARDGTYIGSASLGGISFPVDDNVVQLAQGLPGPYVDTQSASLASAFNGNLGWINVWAQLPNATNSSTTANQLLSLYVDGDNYLIVEKLNVAYLWRISFEGGNLRRRYDITIPSTDFVMLTVLWDQTTGYVKMALNGNVFVQSAGTNVFTGSLATVHLGTGTNPAGAFSWNGGIGHIAIGAGSIPALSAFNMLWETAYQTGRNFTVLGDSKSDLNDSWVSLLTTALQTATGDVWRESPGRQYALSGEDSVDLLTFVEANLADETGGDPEYVLLNIGSNDLFNTVTESTYKTAVIGIVDEVLAKYASTIIYIAKPWRSGYDTAADTMAGWIDDIVALYGNNVQSGHDENIWLENGDNGATYSSDGIHYSTAGELECVAQWMAILPV